MRKHSLKEKKLLYEMTHKLLCPQCEKKTPKQMMLENMWDIPFLVKSKCPVCGYEGIFVEVPIKNEVRKEK